MKRLLCICLAAVSLLAVQSTVLAEPWERSEGLQAELRYFSPSLDTLTVNTGAIHFMDGGSVDFVRELGVDADNTPELRLGWGDRWQFDYMKMDSSGKAEVRRWLHYNGHLIGIGAVTYTDIKMTYAKLAYQFPWLDDGTSRAWFVTDLKYVKFDSSVYAPFVPSPEGSRSVYAAKSYSAVMPTAGAGMELKLEKMGDLRLWAEGSVLPFTKYGPSYDLDVNLRYKAGAALDLVAGYRLIKIHADEDPEVDFKIKGPYFGLRGTF